MASRSVAVCAVVLAACLLAGCAAAPDDLSEQRSAFLGGADTPAPESTIAPSPGAWDGIPAAEGYRVVVIHAEGDPTADTLVSAVHSWAATSGAEVDDVAAATPDDVETAITVVAAETPDLIVGAGAGTVDVFSLVTAQFLDQQFLVLGAQLPEPTANVTAVVWPGAGFRGTGITPDDATVDGAVTPERASAAVEAGYASIRLGVTGVVVSLP
jgi:hypothetical protein